MAHRLITQVIITGSRVVGRAFVEAYRHAKASQKYAAATAAANGTSSSSSITGKAYAGLTIDEACRILNVKPDQFKKEALTGKPENVEKTMKEIAARYEKLFTANDPQKGGSFYLQSKIYRARERLEGRIKEVAPGSRSAAPEVEPKAEAAKQ